MEFAGSRLNFKCPIIFSICQFFFSSKLFEKFFRLHEWRPQRRSQQQHSFLINPFGSSSPVLHKKLVKESAFFKDYYRLVGDATSNKLTSVISSFFMSFKAITRDIINQMTSFIAFFAIWNLSEVCLPKFEGSLREKNERQINFFEWRNNSKTLNSICRTCLFV
jgi:hypothetical protein